MKIIKLPHSILLAAFLAISLTVAQADLNNGPGQTLTITGTQTVAGTIGNQGTIILAGSLRLSGPADPFSVFFPPGYPTLNLITLNGGGEVQLDGNSSITSDTSIPFVFNSLHNVDNLVSGGNGATISTSLINRGTLRATSGTLRTAYISNQSSGKIEVKAGATLNAGPIPTNSGGIGLYGGSISGGGTVIGAIELNSGSTLEPGLGATTGQILTTQNVRFNPGSTFKVNFFADGNHDRLDVLGTGFFDGSLVLGLADGFIPSYNSTYRLANTTGAVTGTFRLNQGQSVGYGLRINFLAGDGNDIELFSGVAPGAVDIATATPSQAASVSGSYSSANTGTTFTYQSLDVLPGASVTLGANDIFNLTAGPLVVAPGAVFTGNGLIQGEVINHGLIRIPIERLATISQVQGGYTEVVVPFIPNPTFESQEIVEVGSGTLLGISGGLDSATILNAPEVANAGVLSIGMDGGADASLEITGDYTQTETGKLRLFIGGDEKGVSYSHLKVGGLITLDGEIEIVLQPDFAGFLPTVGETFDLLEADGGITIPLGINLVDLVTQSGASLVPSLTLTTFDSGIEGDPDSLFNVSETLFSYALAENGTILRATYVGPELTAVPEPSTYAMYAVLGGVAGFAFLRNRRKVS